MTPEQITAIIVAVLASNGALTTLIVVISEAIKRKSDKKNGIQKELVEIKEQIEKTSKKLDEHIAQSHRNKILEFQNSCFRGERHSYEEFQEVLDAIQYYEEFVETNKVKNEKCKMAIKYIRGIYESCQEQSDFAPMCPQMIGDKELKQIIADVLAQNKH